jgi:hypothetical protein
MQFGWSFFWISLGQVLEIYSTNGFCTARHMKSLCLPTMLKKVTLAWLATQLTLLTWCGTFVPPKCNLIWADLGIIPILPNLSLTDP